MVAGDRIHAHRVRTLVVDAAIAPSGGRRFHLICRLPSPILDEAGDLEVEAGHARHAPRMRQQAHPAHAEVAQDLRADAVGAQVHRFAARAHGLRASRPSAPCVAPRTTARLCEQRLGRRRAVQHDQRAFAVGGDLLQRPVDAPRVRAAVGDDQVERRQRLVHAHQRFAIRRRSVRSPARGAAGRSACRDRPISSNSPYGVATRRWCRRSTRLSWALR